MVLQVRKSYLITTVLWLNCMLILLLHLNGFHQQAGLLIVPSAIMFAPFLEVSKGLCTQYDHHFADHCSPDTIKLQPNTLTERC